MVAGVVIMEMRVSGKMAQQEAQGCLVVQVVMAILAVLEARHLTTNKVVLIYQPTFQLQEL
jgi:hypothetical protein